jgi:hypothetical protein
VRADLPPAPWSVHRAGTVVVYFGLAVLASTGVALAMLLVVMVMDSAGDGPQPDGLAWLVLNVGALGLVQIVLGGMMTSAWSARHVLVGASGVSGAMCVGAVVWSPLLNPAAIAYWFAVLPGMLCVAAVDIASVRVALRSDVRYHARAVRQARRSARAAKRLVRSGA